MSDILTHFNLSDPQARAVQARDGDVVVVAGAGTGKTRTLVARYLSLLADGIELRRIVAVTFTRKAAREMRNRVRADIGRYLARSDLQPGIYQSWQQYQNELDAARIGTIHNLCSEILRSHPAEAGVDPRFNVLDELQSALLVQEAVEAAMAWAVQTGISPGGLGDTMRQLFGLLTEGQLQDLIGTMLYQRPSMKIVLDSLPPETIYDHWQRQLADEQAEALTRLTAEPAWVENLSLLKRATPLNNQDLRVQQQQMVLAALSEAESEATTAGQLRALSRLNTINLQGGSVKAWDGGKEEAEAVKGALRTVRDLWRSEPLLSLALNARDEALAAVMPAIYALFDCANRHYVAAKAEREALDFDDLEGLAVALLAGNAAVRIYWQEQIEALLVDEFQDTNARQRHFIRLLCPEPGKLFIVGDAKQSIYRFRGADVTVFQRERADIQSTGGSDISLNTSYRAHAALLESMNRLLQPIMGSDSPERPHYVAPFDPLVAADKEIALGLTAPFVEFHVALGNKGNALPTAANGLARRLADLHEKDGIDYGDIAILCRASSAFQYYEDALDAAGIPYLTVAGKGFYDRPEIRDLINGLQAAADPHDDLALAGFLRSPGCGLSDEALYYLAKGRPANRSLWETILQGVKLPDDESQKRLEWAADLLSRLHQQAGRTRAADLLKLFLDETNYLAALRLAGQSRALRNVAKLLTDIHNSELVDVSDFLVYAQNLKASGSREGEARSTAGGAVQIMSIHQAKGLEFPVVVLGDAAAGGSNRGQSVIIDPALGVLLGQDGGSGEKSAAYELGKALNGAQEAAEVDRLLYVALTRAEQVLMISGHGRTTKTGMSLPGWLGQLADVTGLSGCSIDDYQEEGERFLTFDLAEMEAETAVTATLYEPNFRPRFAPVEQEQAEVQHETLSTVHRLLQTPIMASHPVQEDQDELPPRVWQVVPTARQPHAPAWLVGTLVHEAIALWRFPGDALVNTSFEKWIKARARGKGLTDRQQLSHAVTAVGLLLERFRQWQQFPEIERAEPRFHELPYTFEVSGGVETGYIDLLYRHNGRWTIIDFKTDEIRDDSTIDGFLVNQGYVAQIERYGKAVANLLGERPQLVLCLLNGPEGIISRQI